MKKIATFALMFAAAAALGTALTGAASDETPASNKPSSKSTKPCCQAKAAATTQSVADAKTPQCCDKGNAKGTVLAKTESSSKDVCPAGEKLAGCLHCGKVAATKTADKALVATSTTAKAKEANCNGDCGTGTAAKIASTSAKSEVQKCALCKGGECKQECSRCAEASKETAADETDSTPARVPGRGLGAGRGMGHGRAGDSQHEKDHQDFFFLIEHRDSLRRTVKNLPNGIESLTESDDPDVAEMIQVHVEAMYDRLENANPIRMRDPIFREVFANADKIKMKVEHTEKGVRVTETSTDAYAVKLMQEHAKVVSLWIKNGYSELPKNHPAPKR